MIVLHGKVCIVDSSFLNNVESLFFSSLNLLKITCYLAQLTAFAFILRDGGQAAKNALYLFYSVLYLNLVNQPELNP